MAIEIFLTGGSGILGKELLRISENYDIKFVAFSSQECDITSYLQVEKKILNFNGDTIIHAAAFTNISEIQKDPLKAIEVNIIGTINLLKACRKLNKKLIYISTDHVFDGSKGFYTPNDSINPISNYAKSKASAELIVRMFNENLVIRTSFFDKEFPYEQALCDQWTSKDYVDVIAPMIMDKILTKETGVAHVGTERKSVYELATKRSPGMEKITRREINHVCEIGKDYSFNCGDKNDKLV